MEGIKTDSPAARRLAAQLGDEPFTLIDVGCSGGLDAGWNVFGNNLRALAFDPSLPEIARLQALETRPLVEYVAALVGLPPGHPLDHEHPQYHWWRRNPWNRLAVARREEVRAGGAPPIAEAADARWKWPAVDPLPDLPPHIPPGDVDPARSRGAEAKASAAGDVEKHLALLAENRWGETPLVEREVLVHLPSVLTAHGINDVDFVKIDTDGPDYQILLSLQEVMTAAQVLGVTLEVNFFGTDAQHHHSFHNTDRLMRRLGFDLYGLTVRPYTSSALPSRFVRRDVPSSLSGRPIQGDAFYARDTGWKGAGEIGPVLSPAKLAKLAAIFALFDLPDQAAEVLLRHRQTLASLLDVDAMLDELTEEAWPGSGLTHAELIARFDADDPMFYPPEPAAAEPPSLTGLPKSLAHRLGARCFQPPRK